MAEKGPVNEAYLVTSFMDFLDTFGGFTTKDGVRNRGYTLFHLTTIYICLMLFGHSFKMEEESATSFAWHQIPPTLP